MLVLTRKPNDAGGEGVVVRTRSGDVIVRVIRINGNQVRLGFEADKSIPIFREELLSE